VLSCGHRLSTRQ